MGATAGAFAAAATTPLDVIKTNMMCTAASRPTMMSSARAVLAQGGPVQFFRCAYPTYLHREFQSVEQALLYDHKNSITLFGLPVFSLLRDGCRGVGPRALSNGINSAVFFCFFEALRGSFKKRKALVSISSRAACCCIGAMPGVLDDVLKCNNL